MVKLRILGFVILSLLAKENLALSYDDCKVLLQASSESKFEDLSAENNYDAYKKVAEVLAKEEDSASLNTKLSEIYTDSGNLSEIFAVTKSNPKVLEYCERYVKDFFSVNSEIMELVKDASEKIDNPGSLLSVKKSLEQQLENIKNMEITEKEIKEDINSAKEFTKIHEKFYEEYLISLGNDLSCESPVKFNEVEEYFECFKTGKDKTLAEIKDKIASLENYTSETVAEKDGLIIKSHQKINDDMECVYFSVELADDDSDGDDEEDTDDEETDEKKLSAADKNKMLKHGINYQDSSEKSLNDTLKDKEVCEAELNVAEQFKKAFKNEESIVAEYKKSLDKLSGKKKGALQLTSHMNEVLKNAEDNKSLYDVVENLMSSGIEDLDFKNTSTEAICNVLNHIGLTSDDCDDTKLAESKDKKKSKDKGEHADKHAVKDSGHNSDGDEESEVGRKLADDEDSGNFLADLFGLGKKDPNKNPKNGPNKDAAESALAKQDPQNPKFAIDSMSPELANEFNSMANFIKQLQGCNAELKQMISNSGLDKVAKQAAPLANIDKNLGVKSLDARFEGIKQALRGSKIIQKIFPGLTDRKLNYMITVLVSNPTALDSQILEGVHKYVKDGNIKNEQDRIDLELQMEALTESVAGFTDSFNEEVQRANSMANQYRAMGQQVPVKLQAQIVESNKMAIGIENLSMIFPKVTDYMNSTVSRRNSANKSWFKKKFLNNSTTSTTVAPSTSNSAIKLNQRAPAVAPATKNDSSSDSNNQTVAPAVIPPTVAPATPVRNPAMNQ